MASQPPRYAVKERHLTPPPPPRLVAAVNFEDHGRALRAGPAVALQHGEAGGHVRIAHVALVVLAAQLGLPAVLAHPRVARAALPGAGQEAPAVVHGAGPDELAALAGGVGRGPERAPGVRAGGQHVQLVPHGPDLAIHFRQLLRELLAPLGGRPQRLLQRLRVLEVLQHILRGGQHGHLAFQQHLLPVRLVLGEQPGLGQVEGQELAVEGALALVVHAEGLGGQARDVLREARGATRRVAVGARHPLSHALGVCVTAYDTGIGIGHGGHFEQG